MKQKQKSKVSKISSRSVKKEEHYPAYYLAIVLASVLLIEGLMLGAATPVAWQQGMEVLDMSGAIGVVLSDLANLASPMMDQVGYINDFYQLAATEMIAILDFSDHDFMAGPRMVAWAYDAASVEVAKMIDFSGQAEYWPQVAGASLHR